MSNTTGEQNKIEAQKRTEQIDAFRNELTILEKETDLVLSNSQKSKINQYHEDKLNQFASDFDVDLSVESKQLSLGMKIASLVGALAMTSSIFFLFFQFWGFIATPAQVAILVSAPLISLLLTFWTVSKDDNGYYAKIAALISYGCLVLNLTMLGEIFNITPSPNAVLVWSIYALLLAYACQARLLLFFAIVGFLNFLAMKFGTWFGIYWISFGERPENFFIPALVLFLLPLKISHPKYRDFDSMYRVLALVSLFLPLLILGNFGSISYLSWELETIEGFYQVTGFVIATLVIWLGIKFHWRDTVNTGVIFLVLFVYTKFFDWWWELMPKYLFFFILGVVSILALILFNKIRRIKINQEYAR